MGIRFAKVDGDLDSNPKIRRAGRTGREVFLFVLRRNSLLDRSGRVPMTYLAAWYLADQLMMSEAEAADGLARALDAGLLAVDDGCVVIIGWDDDWSKGPMTESARKAKQRSKLPHSSGVESSNQQVTDPEVCVSRNVTIRNVTDRDCPDSHALDQIRSEESRSEERESSAPVGSPALVLVPTTRAKRPKVPKPTLDATGAERVVALAVLARLSEESGARYSGAAPHLRLIVGRLRDGITEGQLRAVVGYCADEWKGDDKMHAHLCPETLFGPVKIHKYLPPACARYAKLIDEFDNRARLEAAP